MTPPNEIPLCTSNHCATDVYRERAEDADLSRPAGVAQDNNAEGAFRWSRAMICSRDEDSASTNASSLSRWVVSSERCPTSHRGDSGAAT